MMSRHELRVITRPSAEPHWYALRVQPQKEYAIAFLLRRQGVRTFVPTVETWRRRSRYVRHKASFALPQIPGFVFAGFDGAPEWFHLLGNDLILGVQGMGGRPARLAAGPLHQYFANSLDGCLVIDGGLRLVLVPGRGLLRSPTTQVRVVSRRRREAA